MEHAFIGIWLLFWLFFLVVGLFGTIFWIWMLIDCVTNNHIKDNEKLLWVIVLVFSHLIGSILYFFIVRQKRVRY
ncbi:MAG TPA: PLDc N-terminal domain-containing protein [Blastocatellia bacterium]|nr:PLDc N-terminal domain-containing protein [Blastocatellia bacterium]